MAYYKHGRFLRLTYETPKTVSFTEHIKEIDFEDIQKLEMIRYLYITKGYTAKKVCEILGVKYTSEIQTRICKCFPKQMGHGGKRR